MSDLCVFFFFCNYLLGGRWLRGQGTQEAVLLWEAANGKDEQGIWVGGGGGGEGWKEWVMFCTRGRGGSLC